MNRDFHEDCYFVNCERTVLFSVKRDLEPPFTTLIQSVTIEETLGDFLTFIKQVKNSDEVNNNLTVSIITITISSNVIGA